jgi:hypothetical protein
MANSKFPLQFRSGVAPLIERLIQEKQAVGYKYEVGALALERLDRFLAKKGLTQCELPRELALKWLAKRPHESAANHGYQDVRVERPIEDLPAHLPLVGHGRDDRQTGTLAADTNHRGFTPGQSCDAHVVIAVNLHLPFWLAQQCIQCLTALS